MRIATWNLARPVEVRGSRLKRLAATLAANPADIWILTETVTSLAAPEGFHLHHSQARECDASPSERWVTIWSRYEIVERLTTSDPERHAAVRLRIPQERDLIVCGTVLPWLGSSWGVVPAAGGAAFAAAVHQQRANWQEFAAAHPEADLLVAGDFNQDFGLTQFYGSKANRAVLGAALDSVGARILTGGRSDPVPRHSADCASIDHIAVRSSHPGWAIASTYSWPRALRPDKSLSDHFGVAVQRGDG